MRIWAITVRVLKELFRDKRTLALMFLAPILVLSLMKVIFNTNNNVDVNIGTVRVEQSLKKTIDKTKHVDVTSYSSTDAAKKALKSQKLDAVIDYHDDAFTITYANVDASKTNIVKQVFASSQVKDKMASMAQRLKQAGQTIGKLSAATGVRPPAQQKPAAAPTVHNVYAYGNKDTSYFDKILPILMAFFVFLFVFLISGMALLRERTTGTLDRLLATPVKRSDIVFGYVLSYGFLAILQTLVIVMYTIWVLNVEVVGSIFWVLLINFVLAMVALAFGILMSTFARSEFQMMQFIPLILVPQIFFSGIISLDSMANWVQWIADIMPIKYAGESLTNVVMTGANFGDIWGDLAVLLGFLIVLVWGNIVGLKRYRKV